MNTLSTRLITIWLILIVALGYININIFGKERVIREGQPVLLELAPVDPRSLMQGDYMILDYSIGHEVYEMRESLVYPHINNEPKHPEKGSITIRLDENNVAQFVSFHNPNIAVRTGELLLNYSPGSQWRSVSFGADNYFFQEGTADLFEEARYGELRVKEDGTAILINLVDDNFQQIVAP